MRYNPYTQSVEILSNVEKIAALVSELRGDLCIVRNALEKIHVSREGTEGDWGLTGYLGTGERAYNGTRDGQKSSREAKKWGLIGLIRC